MRADEAVAGGVRVFRAERESVPLELFKRFGLLDAVRQDMADHFAPGHFRISPYRLQPSVLPFHKFRGD